ncbi:MAG: TRAP transporter small permease [Aquamicrobium sp.]|jgi:TRAP-type C4-dicarboxylate transport system permease small subunit|nr:TRAP transporter small permease [Aquamicrobium sp.]
MMQSQPPANGASALLARIESMLALLSGLSLGAIMLIVVADVAMRYLFAAPLSWSYNLIGLYLMVAVFFFALSDTLHNHGHIAIDIFQHQIPHRPRHLALAVGYLLSSGLMALIGWQAWLRLKSAYLNDDRIAAVIPWPTWIAYFIVATGCVVMTARCIYRTFGHAASGLSGRDLVETPPPPETEPHAGEGAE